MSKNSKQKTPIPIFITKLLEMLEDQSANDYIKWAPDGDGFIITKITGFTEHILPKYFKHQNISSFIRQLNMYGFTKTRTEEWENIYINEHFQKGNKNALKKIQRKLPKNDIDKEMERPAEKDSLDKKQIQQLMQIKQKQNQLERKCQQLIKQNQRLMQENMKIMKAYEKDERNRITLFNQIQQIALQPPQQNSLIAIDQDNQMPMKKKGKIQEGTEIDDHGSENAFGDEEINGRNISAAQIFEKQEKFLSINDFCNIPDDSFSQGMFFE